ncbi:MAG: Rpn family recombination-promoting nuclease/putative transposase [Chlamydiia bacterium]|nr:Rpn family recombination-promoting nuclease/putative transposase [Chlamydiia bacterium]
MSSRYLDPTNEVAFKHLFGTEDHKSLLISFLNAMLGLKNKRLISEIQIIPQEQVPTNKEAKTSILDIQCTDKLGHKYIVEMQNHHVPDFIKRSQYYASHSYVSQSLRGTSHLELKPIILLAIANHILFPKKKKVISYHRTLDTHTYENDLQDLAYVYVELPRFNKTEDGKNNEAKNAKRVGLKARNQANWYLCTNKQ